MKNLIFLLLVALTLNSYSQNVSDLGYLKIVNNYPDKVESENTTFEDISIHWLVVRFGSKSWEEMKRVAGGNPNYITGKALLFGDSTTINLITGIYEINVHYKYIIHSYGERKSYDGYSRLYNIPIIKGQITTIELTEKGLIQKY